MGVLKGLMGVFNYGARRGGIEAKGRKSERERMAKGRAGCLAYTGSPKSRVRSAMETLPISIQKAESAKVRAERRKEKLTGSSTFAEGSVCESLLALLHLSDALLDSVGDGQAVCRKVGQHR